MLKERTYQQHAAVAGVGVDVVGEVGGDALVAVKDAEVAHAVHAIGVPQGIIAQVDAHREARHRLVVDVLTGTCHQQREQYY